MSLEGINHAGHLKKNKFVVILNDNEMSISKNVGALAKYLTKITTQNLYLQLEADVWELLGKVPHGSTARKLASRIKESIKNLVVPTILFEELGFRYLGPLDGHDIPQLITTFSSLHQLPGPVLVHVVTKKGKGYSFAEKNAEKYHGVGSFYKTTGDSRSGKGSKKYSKVFGEALTAMARSDDRIVAVTAAMKEGTGLTCFADEFPDRFFDVGISEQHAVTFAAGLARYGMKPYVAIYSTFLQRGFDQVIHDVALQKLPVRFILDRAGIVGEDGPTHHGTFDLSYMGMIPGMIVMAPSNECDMTRMLLTTGEIDSGPSALRFPRGSVEGVDMSSCEQPVEIGKAKVLLTGDDATLIAIGSMTGPALKAAELILAKGIATSVIDARFAKPIDSEIIIRAASGKGPIFVIEENAVSGGFGDAVARLLSREGIQAPVIRIGIEDMFVPHGGREELLDEQGLSAAKIAETVISTVSNTDPEADGGSR